MVEETLLHHFSHEHPLCLTEAVRGNQCTGCWRYFSAGEAIYICSQKCDRTEILFHEECAEMPKEIRHPVHPQHTLIQKKGLYGRKCALCQTKNPSHFGYYCPTSNCQLWIHLGCAPYMGVIHVADAEEKSTTQHPSHPMHELMFLRRNKRLCSFKCDACGTMENGNSYICSICQYWIHESCAFLPLTMELREYLHHHPLSLAFQLPQEYVKYDYKCDVCRKTLPFKHWVYHCQSCRYVVHIKCAVSPPAISINKASVADEGVIEFPTNDVSEELIRPFVMRERGEEIIIPHDNEIINKKYRFHNHRHELSLISLEENNNDDDNDDDDDDHHLDHSRRSELICDGCTAPIYQKKTEESSSSSSTFHKHKYYMSCDECKYFLHLACFHLPSELPSHPFHHNHHNLILQTCHKLNFTGGCHMCYRYTNGLMYSCTQCNFRLDIKCASLPNTIKHVAHPQHLLHFKMANENLGGRCGACGKGIFSDKSYKCESCEFSLDCGCVLLPATVMHRWDYHPLPLTYDANINHPGEFYCDICEKEMNPKKWMYHCRECDRSFHPDCFSAASGFHRNIKFGQQYYVVTGCHDAHHPLTYQLITTKKCCDLCHWTVYGYRGFYCAICNFVMCAFTCGRQHINAS